MYITKLANNCLSAQEEEEEEGIELKVEQGEAKAMKQGNGMELETEVKLPNEMGEKYPIKEKKEVIGEAEKTEETKATLSAGEK